MAKALKAHDAKHAAVAEATGEDRVVMDLDRPRLKDRLRIRSSLKGSVFVEAYVYVDGDDYGGSSAPEVVHQPGHTDHDERVGWVVAAVQARL